MSVILLDSFDDGLYPLKWTFNNSAATSTSSPRTGTNKLLVNGSDVSVYKELGSAAHATIIVGCGYSPHTLTPNGRFLNFLSDAGATNHINFLQISTGGFQVYRGGTLIATTSPNLFQVNTWYHVEIKIVLNDATGSIELKVNNTSVFTFNGDTKNGGTESVISRVHFGPVPGSVVNANFSIDDAYILNGAGSSNNNFKGDSRIYNVLPNGNGNYSQFVGSDSNSIDNYLLVDENPVNTSDYVSSGTPGNKDSYAFADLPASVTQVFAVGQRTYAASADAGVRAARNLVRIGGTDYTGSDYNVGTSYLLYETLYDVSPATSTAFTPSEFNGAEWGVEART